MNAPKRYLDCYRTIWRLALPLFIGQLGNIALAFADNIMVGRYSTEALASASFVNNIFNIAIFACMGFAYGLTPLIGALFAKGDNDGIGRLTRIGLRVNTIFTIFVMALMTTLYFFLDRLGQPAELLPLIRPYYLIVLSGMLPLMLFNVLSQWSFAINNTGIPTWIVLACNVINVVGNYMLIYGHFGCPELGLIGAGISTFVSRVLTALVMAAVFFCSPLGRRYMTGFRRSKARKGEYGKVARTGFPVAMQMTFETTSFSGSALMAGWLGAVPLAAFQIVAITGMLGFCLYYSIASAMAIPMSHAAGRGDCREQRRLAWSGLHMVLLCMLITCCTFIFGGRGLMGLFSEDPAVVTAAMGVISAIVLYQLGDAVQITFANALRGTSRVMPMLYIAFVSYVMVGLPVTYLLAFPAGLGLYGIVLSFSVCLMLAGVLYLFFFLRATRARA